MVFAIFVAVLVGHNNIVAVESLVVVAMGCRMVALVEPSWTLNEFMNELIINACFFILLLGILMSALYVGVISR